MAANSKAIKAGEAFVSLMLDDEQFAKGIENWKDNLEGLSRRARTFGRTFASIGAVITAPFVLGTRNLISFASELDLAAARLGVAGEEFAQLATFARLTGVELEALEIGMKTIGERIVQLQANSNETAQAFQQLGIDADKFLTVGDNWQRLMMIADGMKDVNDAGLQSGLALRALGEAGNRLLPFLRLGSEGLEQMRREMRDLAVTDQMLDLSRDLRVEWVKLTLASQKLTMSLATAVGPEIRRTLNFLNDGLATLIGLAERYPVLARLTAGIGTAAAILGGLGLGASGLAAALSVVATGFGMITAAAGTTTAAVAAMVTLAGLGFWALIELADDLAEAITGIELSTISLQERLFGMQAIKMDFLVDLSEQLELLPPKLQRAARAFSDSFNRLVFGLPDEVGTPSVRFGSRATGAPSGTSPRTGVLTAGIQGAFASRQTLGFAAVSVQDSQLTALRDIASTNREQLENDKEFTDFLRGMFQAK